MITRDHYRLAGRVRLTALYNESLYFFLYAFKRFFFNRSTPSTLPSPS